MPLDVLCLDQQVENTHGCQLQPQPTTLRVPRSPSWQHPCLSHDPRQWESTQNQERVTLGTKTDVRRREPAVKPGLKVVRVNSLYPLSVCDVSVTSVLCPREETSQVVLFLSSVPLQPLHLKGTQNLFARQRNEPGTAYFNEFLTHKRQVKEPVSRLPSILFASLPSSSYSCS